jgi:hypothetical protein
VVADFQGSSRGQQQLSQPHATPCNCNYFAHAQTTNHTPCMQWLAQKGVRKVAEFELPDKLVLGQLAGDSIITMGSTTAELGDAKAAWERELMMREHSVEGGTWRAPIGEVVCGLGHGAWNAHAQPGSSTTLPPTLLFADQHPPQVRWGYILPSCIRPPPPSFPLSLHAASLTLPPRRLRLAVQRHCVSLHAHHPRRSPSRRPGPPPAPPQALARGGLQREGLCSARGACSDRLEVEQLLQVGWVGWGGRRRGSMGWPTGLGVCVGVGEQEQWSGGPGQGG